MSAFLVSLNSFLEDTCVLVVVAFLLTRGKVLAFIFGEGRRSGRNAILAGLLLGAVGATEYIFPNQRYPYVPQTLFVTFASLACGFRVGAVTALVVLASALPTLATKPTDLCALALSVALSVGVGRVFRRRSTSSVSSIGLGIALAAGVLAQAGATILHLGVADLLHTRFSLAHALVGIPANGIGVLLLALVVKEANLRAQSEHHRTEAEHARTVAAQHQFSALRARVHPHFLFNTLTSIAALCNIAPDKAENATVRLGALMRRALETDPTLPIALTDEIADVRDYTEIERLRLGDRLQIIWDLPPTPDLAVVHIPPFALLTLAENAVQHGVASRLGPGRVTISVRGDSQRKWVMLAVSDTGDGMPLRDRRRALVRNSEGRVHGLVLLDEQLRLLYGPSARLHLFSSVGKGTLVAFRVPVRSLQRKA